jgi:hypothetical protein
MPLARILTAFPERAESLAQQLRDQGYSVEFLSPEKAGMLRADLEIDFEICDQKVVLRRAAELANKLNADIAVSPYALPANFAGSEIYVGEHEILEVPSHLPDPHVAHFLAPGDRSGQIGNLDNSGHTVSLPPDMLAAESPRARAQQYQVQPDEQKIEPVISAANFSPVDISSAETQDVEPLRSIDVPSVPDPERHAGSFGFETHGFEKQSLEASQHNQPQQVHQSSEPEPEAVKPEWMERTEALSSSAMAAARQKSASMSASAKRLGADCIEWINVRMAAAQDKRHQRQIEAEKQREIARMRAEELEIARDAAAARLQELLRERGGLTDQQPAPPSAGPIPAYQQSETRAASGWNQPASASFFAKLPVWFERFKEIALQRKYGQQWEAVLMGVAAACALFVVGVAVNSFRPHPALSNTINPSSSPASSLATPVSARVTAPGATSPKPYNGVTVQAGKPGVTLLPAAPIKAVPAQTSQIQVASNKPSPQESDVTVRHVGSFNKPTPRRGSASDVTVRHFNQPARPATRSTDGVKRFSDLD